MTPITVEKIQALSITSMMKNQNMLNGGIFIIPNPSFRMTDHSGYKVPSFVEEINAVYWANRDLNKNGVEFNDTRFVECWFHNPDNENWKDHGIWDLEKDDPFVDDRWRLSTSWVPDWVFKDHAEGDVVTFNMPVERRVNNRGVIEHSTIRLSVKLDQSNYRYSRFGKFEEVLKRV